MVPSLFTTLCFVLTGLYCVAFINLFAENGHNKCAMTFMFEYPQFVRIAMVADGKFPRYGLYAYSEGRATANARNMFFEGIPVLFIPGNAGSHKQVRSFASVALRKALDNRPGFHFDFFAVDLNDELSGLNGALLNDQSSYVEHSLEKILELYEWKKGNAPKSVIVIAHSMGGILIRGVLSDLPSNSTLISLVITLATPHRRSPIPVDSYTREYYNKIQLQSVVPHNVTFISLSGGYNDFLVSPNLVGAKQFDNMEVATTSIPKVWLAADHLCILWCKQLVMVVTDALFECIDVKHKRLNEDHEYRKALFHHHLIHNSGIKFKNRDRYRIPVSLTVPKERWIERITRQYTVNLYTSRNHTEWHMIRLIDLPKHEFLTAVALNLDHSEWVFACAAAELKGTTRACKSGVHLSHVSEIAPSVIYKRRSIEINLHHLAKFFPEASHLVVKMPPSKNPVILHVDVYSPSERNVTVRLPDWWDMREEIVIEETIDKAIHYSLEIPDLKHVIQSYELRVIPHKCVNEAHHATASLVVPWAHHDAHAFFSAAENEPFNIRLYSSRPEDSNVSAVVKLMLDPACKYHVTLKPSLLGTVGQMARIYSPMLVTHVVVVILFCLRRQLHCLQYDGRCSFFFSALEEGIKPYLFITIVKTVGKYLSDSKILMASPDEQVLLEEGIDLVALPLLMYMCSVGIVGAITLLLTVSLVVCESTLTKIVTKFLARTFTGTLSLSDWLLSGLHKIPSVVACLLAILSIYTCGGLAIWLGCIFYFLKLTQMAQDYIEHLLFKALRCVAATVKRYFTKKKPPKSPVDVNETTQIINHSENCDSKDDTGCGDSRVEEVSQEQQQVEKEPVTQSDVCVESSIFFHFTILLLWGCIAVLNIPYVLTWARNFNKYLLPDSRPFVFNVYSAATKAAMYPDPSMIPGVVLNLCAIPLWQLDLPRINKRGYVYLSFVMYGLACLSVMMATVSLYRLVNFMLAAIVALTLHQLLAPTRSVAFPDSGETPPDTLQDRVKAKWE